MTPGARVAAAIELLDTIIGGAAAEAALTGWARRSRFAGSKDRAAVRDHVFDALRARRTLAVLGGAATGRGIMIGLARRENWDLSELFSGVGHAPAQLSPAEIDADADIPQTSAAKVDMPDWIWPQWADSLGDKARDVARVLQYRAPVFLRVNQRNGDTTDVIASLAADGIVAHPHPDIKTCLKVIENPRKIQMSKAYIGGLIEVQDAASQAAMLRIPVLPQAHILDYCAGGGGKALALVDMYACAVSAHDISTDRMRDIPIRAERAGVNVSVITASDLAQVPPFDVVLCDAPCSGSGTWRRTPDAKWKLSAEKVLQYNQVQRDVLQDAAGYVKDDGILAYATCSVLDVENRDVVSAFCSSVPGWRVKDTMQWLPDENGDGFFLCILQRG